MYRRTYVPDPVRYIWNSVRFRILCFCNFRFASDSVLFVLIFESRASISKRGTNKVAAAVETDSDVEDYHRSIHGQMHFNRDMDTVIGPQ